MAYVFHNNKVKFPTDFFSFTSVHQHGSDDVRRKRPITRGLILTMTTCQQICSFFISMQLFIMSELFSLVEWEDTRKLYLFIFTPYMIQS